MIASPDDIQNAALRKVDKVLEHLVAGDVDELFPMKLRVSLKPRRVTDIPIAKYAEATQSLIAGSRTGRGHGYTVHLERRRSRELGEQDFPVAVTIDSVADFVYLTDLAARFSQTLEICDKVRSQFPSLENWLLQEARRLDRVSDYLDDLLAVADALTKRPMPDCYLRELGIPADTKFIEKHQSILRRWLDTLLPAHAINVNESGFARRYGLRDGLPHHTIRFLDSQLRDRAGFPCDELSLPMRTLARLQLENCRVYIVENRTNLMTVPPHDNAIALGGVGDSVTRLRDVEWLRNCQLHYWGDCDVDGFRILANFRKLFPDVQSLLMDEETFESHRSLVVDGNGKTCESLPLLDESENAMLRVLSDGNIRLEQERIAQRWVETSLSKTVH